MCHGASGCTAVLSCIGLYGAIYEYIFFFFFQAEDGIRDVAVTEVQTCALPISPAYTEEARRLRIEGEVVLEVVFGASGKLHVVRVVRGLGHGLDENAVRAAEQIDRKSVV